MGQSTYGTCTWRNTGPVGLLNCSTQVGSDLEGAELQDASSRSTNAQESSLLWHLQRECAKLADGGDWDGVNVVNGAIMTLAKAEGKGKGAAKGDSRAKGMSPKSSGKGGDWFDCGAYDHR